MSEEEKTAADFLSELSNDPDYVRQAFQREQERAALETSLKEDEAQLVAELCEAGVPVASVWDLVNTDAPYPKAVPILLKHLSCEHHERTKEGIARALTVPEARGIATKALVKEFVKVVDPSSELKWVLGAAIAETTTPETASLVIDLVRSKKHGKGREFLPLALTLLDEKDAEPILRQLVEDTDTRERAKEAQEMLARKEK